MEERKGVCTPAQEKFVAKALDFWFKFKNAIVEKYDDFMFEQVLKVADNYGLDKLPDTWKNDLIPIIDAAMSNEKETVRLLLVDLLNKKIDIKKLDDEQELVVLDGLSKFIATTIDFYVQKKAA